MRYDTERSRVPLRDVTAASFSNTMLLLLFELCVLLSYKRPINKHHPNLDHATAASHTPTNGSSILFFRKHHSITLSTLTLALERNSQKSRHFNFFQCAVCLNLIPEVMLHAVAEGPGVFGLSQFFM